MFSLLIDEFENVKSSFLLSGCVVYTRAWREGARTPTSSTTLIKKVVSSLMFACFHVDDDDNVWIPHSSSWGFVAHVFPLGAASGINVASSKHEKSLEHNYAIFMRQIIYHRGNFAHISPKKNPTEAGQSFSISSPCWLHIHAQHSFPLLHASSLG